MMGVIMTDESAQPKYVWESVCSRCDLRLVDVVVVDEKPFCYECSAIVRRGETVIKNLDDGKSDGQIINDLILACKAALILRGLATAITDPLALRGEREEYRKRYQEIEQQILGAIVSAKDLKK